MSSSPKPLVELDGSTLEGGGQLLRNAVALSVLTRTPVRIANVRQNRSQPGLKAQHAAGLALVTQISNARAEGIQKGSQCVSFDPTRTTDDGSGNGVRVGEYEADPGTAGSTTLLLQVSLPCLLFCDALGGNSAMTTTSILKLRGGTNALNAPQADYAQRVLLPFLNTHILPSSQIHPLQLDIKQRGFYPYGGGLLHAHIPSLLHSQTLRLVTLTDRGRVVSIEGIVIVSGVINKRIAQEMRDAALLELYASSSPELSSLPHSQITITIQTHPTGRAGSSILLLAHTSAGCTLSGSALGSKGIRAAQSGIQAAKELLRELDEGGCVDCWMQDQMVIFLALAPGSSMVRTGKVTLHTRTAIWVAERLTGARFEVTENVDGSEQSLIVCDGVGLEGRL